MNTIENAESNRNKPAPDHPVLIALDQLECGVALSTIYRALGNSIALAAVEAPSMSIHVRISSGLSGKTLKMFVEAFDLDHKTTATLFGISARSLYTRYRSERLATAESELILNIVRAWLKAAFVFEDPYYARSWLFTTTEALGETRPGDLLVTSDGTRLVLAELGRIEHGLPV